MSNNGSLVVGIIRHDGIFNTKDFATAELVYDYNSPHHSFKFTHQLNKDILRKLKILYKYVKSKQDYSLFLDENIVISSSMNQVSFVTKVFGDNCYSESINNVDIMLIKKALKKVLSELEQNPL